MVNNSPHKHSLTVFLLLANGITWLGWIPGLVIGARQGFIMPRFDNYATLWDSGFANGLHLWLAVAFSLARLRSADRWRHRQLGWTGEEKACLIYSDTCLPGVPAGDGTSLRSPSLFSCLP